MIAYFALNDGTITLPHTGAAAAIMANCGSNIGNLAFWYGARKLIDEEVVYLTSTSQGVPRNLKALVIPAANFIGAHANLTPILKLVRELDLPTIVIGLGAQAESETSLPTIDDACRDFLFEVSRRGPFVGVRGEYSATVCRSIGVANVRVLGCPSVLINPNRNLGDLVQRKIENLHVGSIAVHAACHKGTLKNVERELARYVSLNRGSAYVVQRPTQLIAAIYQESLSATEQEYLSSLSDFFGFSPDTSVFSEFLRRYGYAPTSISSWSGWLRRFSCSINTRIHGTMLALQSEIPSLCISHDTRTRELAKRLLVPTIDIQTFIESRYDIRRLFFACKFDGRAFETNRSEIAEGYSQLFREVGVKPSSHLLSFL